MENLRDLTERLKGKIAEKDDSVSRRNTELVGKITSMNTTAEQILEKVRTLSVNSQTLQQNITAQAAIISDLKTQLTDAGDQHSEKQTQIDNLQNRLAEATARGMNVDALKKELAQLQTEAKEKGEQVTALTKEITNTTEEIQELLASLDSPEVQQSQDQLNGLVQELAQHINEINAALPSGGPVEAIPMPPGAPSKADAFEREMNSDLAQGINGLTQIAQAPGSAPMPPVPGSGVESLRDLSTPAGSSSHLEREEESEPESVSSRATKSRLGNSTSGDIEMEPVQSKSSLNATAAPYSPDWRKGTNPNAKPFTPSGSRGGYVYGKTRKHKQASSTNQQKKPSSSSQQTSSLKRTFKKHGGRRTRRRRKTRTTKRARY